ncbi:odorant receptor Or1-like [Venturia canescens]|uniref:odorant receptor Or1-like n=1 Tax=Venturia canescens TaxID=32260 RepID=UPI001C9C6849|nr:odorant receptor Or1-like [Venturia canescens]
MHTLSLNFTILKFFGLWRPLPWLTGWKFVLYNCYTVIIIVLVFTFLVSLFIDFFSSFNSVEDFAQGSFILLTVIALFGKMVVLLTKRREIIELTNDLINDVCEPRDAAEIQIQARSKRDARWIASWCLVLFVSTAFLMVLTSIIADIPERKLIVKGWFPYAYNSTQTVFLFTFFHQVIATNTGATVNSAFDTLFPGLIILTCSQMKILKYRFEAIPQIISSRKKSSENNGDEDEEKKNRELEAQLLTDCIRHHVRIFQLASTLNGIFGFVIFLQFSISSLVLCVSVYEVTRVDVFSLEFVPIVMYLASMLTQIFILCYYGNELSVQSVDICQAVYRMDWTSFHIGTKSSLIVIMLRSQRPITFVCYNVIVLSLNAFTSLIKLSYSVFNVLSQNN